MAKCQSIWNTSEENIFNKLQSLKDIYEEVSEMDDLIEQIARFRTSSKEKGAILFCYCRGRVSEGIDFADEAARGVVLIGIPLPPLFYVK